MPYFMIFAMKIVRIVERKRGSKKIPDEGDPRNKRTIFQQFHLWIE